MIRAFVGSGGKTGTIFRQAEAYRAQGRRVLVTTSTQMGARAGAIIGDDPDLIIAALQREGYALAGTQASREGKIAALSEETFRMAAAHADIVLVEADGSRQHPLKFPNETEPVIPMGTEEIVVICGLSAIGKPAGDVCHRLELVKAAIGIEEDTMITAQHVQRLVRAAYLDPLSKRYPRAKITLYPCQRDTLYLRAAAALLSAGMDVNLIDERWFSSAALYGNGPATLEIVLSSEDGRHIGAMTLSGEQRSSRPEIFEKEGRRILLLPIERWKVTQKEKE